MEEKLFSIFDVSVHDQQTVLLPWPKKSLQPEYSWDWSAVRSCDIMRHRLLERELTMCKGRGSCRCRTEARYRTISHDRTVDGPHESLCCNDFFGQGSTKNMITCTCTHKHVHKQTNAHEHTQTRAQTSLPPRWQQAHLHRTPLQHVSGRQKKRTRQWVKGNCSKMTWKRKRKQNQRKAECAVQLSTLIKLYPREKFLKIIVLGVRVTTATNKAKTRSSENFILPAFSRQRLNYSSTTPQIQQDAVCYKEVSW